MDIVSFPEGGKEYQVAQLARGLAQRGHSVLLLINKRAQWGSWLRLRGFLY